MKKMLFLFLAAILPMLAGAYDAQIDGIYYNFDQTEKTAEVTYREGGSDNQIAYSGAANIPPTVNYNGETYSVTSIGSWAFENCSGLTSVTIPNSVTSIGDYAFYNCSGLASITIPNSVTSIGEYAFLSCSGLTSVTIPNSVTSIGRNPFSGSGWYNNQSDGILYLDNWLIGYKGEKPTGKLVIAEGTRGIAFEAFYKCSELTSVEIPNSVTSIGYAAFYDCSGLTSVTIGNSVTSIGGGAFYNCSGLTSVTIPNSVTSIGGSAFYNCSGLTSVTIPNSVTSIGGSAFRGCRSLTSVTIPNSVTSIGGYAFDGTGWYNDQPDGILYLDNWLLGYKGDKPTGELVVTDGTKGIAGYFYGCSGLTSVTIPNSVMYICEGYWVFDPYDIYGVFSRCSSLTSVTIGNSVTSIGSYAFSGCSGLTSVTIGNSVKSIGESAFGGCSGLTSVTIPNSVKSIGESAFGGCSGLTSVTISNSVTSIGDGAFQNCSGLTSVTIPNSVKSIGESAFAWCSGLSSVTIPNSVTILKHGTFYGCSSLTTVTIPNSVTCIEDGYYGVFQNCSGLTSVTIPNSVTSIGQRAFQNCSGLTSVTIGNSVTSIRDGAFQNCSGLTSVTIGSSVTNIGNEAFSGCSGLTSVTISNSVTSIGYGAFYECSGLKTVKVPVTDYSTFCSNKALGCISSSLGKPVQLIDSEGAEIKEFIVPEDVTSIGNSAFMNCSGLTSVTIGNNVTNIGSSAFSGCSGLTSITIPNKVTSIGNGAFSGCSGLTSVTFHCKEIGYWFSGFRAIMDVVIGDEVTKIGNSAFSGCRGLSSITIPSSVTSIGNSAFYGCSSLISATIGNGVTSIGESAFSGCGNLETVIAMPMIPPNLEQNSFPDAQNISLYVPIGKKSAYEVADGWRFFKEINEWLGTIFKAVTPQGIEMQFRVVDEGEKTVETFAKPYEVGEDFMPCIDPETEGDLIIPSEIDGYRVVGIGSESFRECMGLTSASLPTGITYIGEGAFRLATSLKAVTIPEGVEEIRAHSFNGCPLTTIILPSTLKHITGTYVFRNSNAKNETCSFIANMKRPSTLDENSIMGMEYYDLYVPKGRKEFYLSEPQWDKFRSIREVGEVDEDVKDIVTAKNVTMKAGKKATLTVSLTTEDTDYNGYQFNLYLPEGISVATDESGNYLVTEKTGRKKVALPVDDGSMLFYTTADKNHAALASGTLMEIELTADSALAAGKYTVRIDRVVCATRNNESVSLPSSTATVTVEKAETDTQGVISADDVEGEPATQIKLPVFLNNATDINAFYFDLTLPMGITVAKDKAGQFIASFVGEYADGKMLLSCLPWDPSMGTTNNVNTWRFIATPIDDNVFRANAGRVMNITLDVDKDMAGGVYTARMNVVKLVEVSGSRADNRLRSVASVSSAPSASWTSYSTITIKTQKQGDVNGDFTIDVADIATVIDVMAGGSGIANPLQPENPLQQAADVNKDGTVDVADIATIIDVMAANARRAKMEE